MDEGPGSATPLRAVLDAAADAVLFSGAAGEVQAENRQMRELAAELGIPAKGTAAERLLAIEHRLADPARHRAAVERLAADPLATVADELEERETGRAFQIFSSPVLDGDAAIGRLWTLREVTRQRELDRRRDEFVAAVSHELRTPLTSMIGFLELIREDDAGSLTEEQRRFLAIVHRSSERLQRLVGDLLFVSRLDSGGLQLEQAPVRLDEVAREIADASSALARSRGVELAAELDPPPPVRGDRERLAQLVGNLVANALAYTPAGGRAVVRAFAEGGRAVVEVEDTGLGIPPAERERVFERFFRSRTVGEDATPGAGLGLPIAKAIAEAHGGSIEVSSEPGAGSTFRVELPLASGEVAA